MCTRVGKLASANKGVQKSPDSECVPCVGMLSKGSDASQGHVPGPLSTCAHLLTTAWPLVRDDDLHLCDTIFFYRLIYESSAKALTPNARQRRRHLPDADGPVHFKPVCHPARVHDEPRDEPGRMRTNQPAVERKLPYARSRTCTYIARH